MRRTACAILVLSIWATGLPADEPAAPPQRRLEASIGAGVVAYPRPYRGTDTAIYAVPVGTLRYGRFWVQGIRAGYRVLGGRGGGLDVLVRPRFDGLDPGDSSALAGMARRELSVDAGVAWSRRRQHLEIGLTATTDVLGRNDGQEVAVEVGFPFRAGTWRLTPAASVAWQASNLVDYYYGVRPEEALPGRPAYSPGSTVNGGASLSAAHRFGRTRWSMIAVASAERPGEEIRDSPIVDASTTAGGFVGILYRLAPSGR